MSSSTVESGGLGRRGAAGPAAAPPRECSACGARARRETARFCSTCGRRLGEDYFPTDWLRASYRFERRPAPQHAEHARVPARPSRFRPRRRHAAARPRPHNEFMPARNQNGASTTALAFVTYALVPYLGILFCPGALLLGAVGLVRSYRSPHAGGRRASALGVVLGLLVLTAQLVLWWVLYKMPEWSRQAMF